MYILKLPVGILCLGCSATPSKIGCHPGRRYHLILRLSCSVCPQECGAACHAPLKCGSLAVYASKLGLLCHPTCFRCSECKELLVDLAYCVHDDALFCERHYAEQLKPRCAACDEVSTCFHSHEGIVNSCKQYPITFATILDTKFESR